MDKCGHERRRANSAAKVLLPEQAGPANTISTLYFSFSWPDALPIAVRIDQRFHESTCFRQRTRSQVGGHRNLGQSIRRSARLGFRFVQPDSREFMVTVQG